MGTLTLEIEIPAISGGHTEHGANVLRQHAVARALRVVADQILSSGFQSGDVMDICKVAYEPGAKATKPRAA